MVTLHLNYVENFIMYRNYKYKGRGREASWKKKERKKKTIRAIFHWSVDEK